MNKESILTEYEDGHSLLLAIDGDAVIHHAQERNQHILKAGPGTRLLPLLDEISRGQIKQALANLKKAPDEAQGPLTLHFSEGEQALRAGLRTLPGHEGLYLLSVIDLSPFFQREKNLQNILEDSLQGIVVHGGQARPLFINRTLARMLGYDSVKEVLEAGDIAAHVDSETLDRLVRYTEDRIAGREAPEEYEIPVRHNDGSTVWLYIRCKLIDWEGVPAVLATVQDISQQKQEEGRRQLSETLFRKIFETSPDMVPITRLKDGTVFDANPAFLDAFGYSREEVINKKTEDLGIFADPSDRQALVKEVQQQDFVRDFQMVCVRKDGSKFPVSLSGTKLRYADEDLLLVVGRDMTERKAQERALKKSIESAEEANRAKSEFLANVSHELRTPLNAILGFSETIRKEMFGPLGSDRYRGYADDIHKSGRHLLEIINEILDLSKLEAGQLNLKQEDVWIRTIVNDALAYVEDEAKRKKISLSCDLENDKTAIRCDPRRMMQVLLNLLSNAVKFTPEGGEIEIGLEAGHDGTRNIIVRDTGPGMTEDEIEEALQPFGQIGSSQTRRHEGTGLGLPIAQAFCELHGGCLDLQSRPGEGTIAIVRLPEDMLVAGPGE